MIDFKLLGGFGNGQTNGRTDICTSRVAFATENAHIVFSAPLNKNSERAYVRGKFLSFLRVSSKILNGHSNMYILDKFQIFRSKFD